MYLTLVKVNVYIAVQGIAAAHDNHSYSAPGSNRERYPTISSGSQKFSAAHFEKAMKSETVNTPYPQAHNHSCPQRKNLPGVPPFSGSNRNHIGVRP